MALTAEYGFNEGSGTTAADSSGAGRTLTGSGWAASAKNGAGVGPTGSFVAAASGIGAAATANFTIMMWVSVPAPAGGNYLGFATSTVADRWFEASVSAGALLLDWFGGGGTLTATSTFPANTPTHIAVTASGATHTLFINGVAAGTGGSFSSSTNLSATDWTIGSGNGNIAPGTGGWIDEVRVDNTALNAAAITVLMNTAIGGGPAAVIRANLNQRPAVIRAAYW